MICVVIAAHNRINYTRNCLKSLRDQTFKNYKVIVVDDGSTDGTADMIRTEYVEVDLLVGDGNLWWSGATNLAIEYAIKKYNPEYIVTFNDDTEADPSFIEKLYDSAVKNPNSLIGGVAYDILHREKIVYGGIRLNWVTGRSIDISTMIEPNVSNYLHEVTYYPGRGLLLPAYLFGEIGYYDKDVFPLSWADIDYVCRAKKRKGCKVYCDYRARLYIYKEESRHLHLKKNKSFKNFLNYLFVQKGGGNILLLTKFAFRHSPKGYIFSFLSIGILSRIFGYFKNN